MKSVQELWEVFTRKLSGREEPDGGKAALTGNEYAQVAAIILEGVGGKGNVSSIDNCLTRLRLKIRDEALLDEKKILSAGVAGVVRPSATAAQMIIGVKAPLVADEFKKLCRADISE